MWLKPLLIPERCNPPHLKTDLQMKVKMLPSAFLLDFIPDIGRASYDCVTLSDTLLGQDKVFHLEYLKSGL